MSFKETINNKEIFLTDGGLETTLIYQHGIELPHFAAFDLVGKPKYTELLADYYRGYLELAKKHQRGFILESATWRANPEWAYKLGYSKGELEEVNRLAIQQLKEIKTVYDHQLDNIYISGCIGPRKDGYDVGEKMTIEQAQGYHQFQIRVLRDAGVDLITALTVNYIEEGLGMTLAAKELQIPVVISFTVELDGKLPGGSTLREAITQIDHLSESYPAYYMINCAHPTHFLDELNPEAEWSKRIKGIRSNASCKSHEELDESEELDRGDVKEFADWHLQLLERLPEVKVFGGCCGTDENHIEAICQTVH
ncbi:MAG: homocysteine S-methyltransferase family protein [Bacteroidetes bacterium]|nr:MAG: homocysteine S-methyltransferase family protein [Bacteroidota bacterium]